MDNVIDLNKNVIDIDKNKDQDLSPIEKAPEKDAVDYYLEPFIEAIGKKMADAQKAGMFGEDLAHATLREFCIRSNFFYCNNAYAVKLVVVNVKDRKTFKPEQSEQYILPTFISDKKYGITDHIHLGPVDNIGGKQAGCAVITKIEHYLYHDNGGILILTKSFIDDKESFDEYCAKLSERFPTLDQENKRIKGLKNNDDEAAE